MTTRLNSLIGLCEEYTRLLSVKKAHEEYKQNQLFTSKPEAEEPTKTRIITTGKLIRQLSIEFEKELKYEDYI
ncbi:hypothetical protein [uncultured Staphylococcus sp.]|uniref:hypothetical protein n=1 Tax=uncultured Staphylococcus sp. TaxID=189668 RepID=UPI0025F8D3DC|nr:hypothetical protein [uncultured Staphylococcus sp.]